MDYGNLAQLVTRAQQGDTAALSELYAATYNPMYFFALKMVGNEQDALDVLQSTYIVMVQKVSSVREPQFFLAWLRRVLVNECNRTLSKNDRYVFSDDDEQDLFHSIEDEDEEFLPESALEDQETQQIIWDAIDRELSTVQKQTMLLFYYDEMKISEIARVTGTNENTVKNRLHESRSKLRKSLMVYRKQGVLAVAPIPILTALLRDMAAQSILHPQTAGALLHHVAAATGVPLSIGVVAAEATVAAAVPAGATVAAAVPVGATAAAAVPVGATAAATVSAGTTSAAAVPMGATAAAAVSAGVATAAAVSAGSTAAAAVSAGATATGAGATAGVAAATAGKAAALSLPVKLLVGLAAASAIAVGGNFAAQTLQNRAEPVEIIQSQPEPEGSTVSQLVTIQSEPEESPAEAFELTDAFISYAPNPFELPGLMVAPADEGTGVDFEVYDNRDSFAEWCFQFNHELDYNTGAQYMPYTDPQDADGLNYAIILDTIGDGDVVTFASALSGETIAVRFHRIEAEPMAETESAASQVEQAPSAASVVKEGDIVVSISNGGGNFGAVEEGDVDPPLRYLSIKNLNLSNAITIDDIRIEGAHPDAFGTMGKNEYPIPANTTGPVSDDFCSIAVMSYLTATGGNNGVYTATLKVSYKDSSGKTCVASVPLSVTVGGSLTGSRSLTNSPVTSGDITIAMDGGGNFGALTEGYVDPPLRYLTITNQNLSNAITIDDIRIEGAHPDTFGLMGKNEYPIPANTTGPVADDFCSIAVMSYLTATGGNNGVYTATLKVTYKDSSRKTCVASVPLSVTVKRRTTSAPVQYGDIAVAIAGGGNFGTDAGGSPVVGSTPRRRIEITNRNPTQDIAVNIYLENNFDNAFDLMGGGPGIVKAGATGFEGGEFYDVVVAHGLTATGGNNGLYTATVVVEYQGDAGQTYYARVQLSITIV